MGRQRDGKGGTTTTTPDKDAAKTGLEKVNKMISGGKSAGFPEAAANLEQWRDRKGDRVMPASAFQTQKFLLDHLAGPHRDKFIAGARKRLADGRIEADKPFRMEWTDSVVAPYLSDLFFALGGFTVRSDVTAVVTKAAGGHELRFSAWDVKISDTYDWDPGKATFIPGVGNVTDDEMLALEKAGYGKAFNVTSETFRVSDPKVAGPAKL